MGQHFAKCAVWWQNELGGHSAPYIPQLYSKPVFSSTTGKSPKQGFISGNKYITILFILFWNMNDRDIVYTGPAEKKMV